MYAQRLSIGLLTLMLIGAEAISAQAQSPQQGQSPQQNAQLAEIPASIYDPTGGPALRNAWRPDIASCSQWWGGPAGTILPPGFTPPPAPPDGVHGLAGVNFSSACHLLEGLASASIRSNGFFVRGAIYGEAVGDWRDGNGDTQRNGFEKRNFSAGLGFVGPDGTIISFDYARAERHKTLYGGAMLDTRFFDADVFTARARLPVMFGALKAIDFSGRAQLFDRENDNFSYRTLSGAATFAQFKRDYIDGKLQAEFAIPGVTWVLGTEIKDDQRDATRWQGPNVLNLVRQSRVQPDTRVTEISGFGDVKTLLSPGLQLLAGLRVSHVSAAAGDLDATGLVTPGFGATPAPRSLIAQYYGLTGDLTASEVNVGGRLRLEQDINHGKIFAGLSRQVRTADPIERYFISFTPPSGAALNPGPVHRTWIGNPGLDPEKHNIAEIGFGWQKNGWTFAGRGYLDWADDFILWDRARGQAGILLANNASVYRNIDAFIAGLSGRVGYKWASGFYGRIDTHFTYGQNLTDDTAIGQIPPLEVITTLGYSTEMWGLEGRVRAVAGQTRLDNFFRTGSGVDGNGLSMDHAGFAVVDLMATWKPLPNMTLQAGVENLFDKAYREHIERNDIDDPFLVNQIASGRSFVLRGLTRF